MNKRTIMLVDDDPSVQRLLKAALEKNGYDTALCTSGEEALESLHELQIDAIILDIVLPGIDGLEVLKRIRSHSNYSQVPVIMLTCKDSETETVLGLEMGADDYLSKPIRYHELLARLKTVFRRASCTVHPESSAISIHCIEINMDTRTTYINKNPVILTYMEFELLILLAKNPGKVFTRNTLLDILWHDEQFVETRTVDVHIRRLRKKIEENGLNPDMIETIRSVGYRLASDGPYDKGLPWHP